MGESDEVVRSDLSKIHEENVARLTALSETELLQEKRQIEQALGKSTRSVDAVRLKSLCVLQDQSL